MNSVLLSPWPTVVSLAAINWPRVAMSAVITVVATLTASCDRANTSPAAKPALPEAVTLGFPRYAGNALVHIAQAKGFFETEGLQVTTQPFSSGKIALENVLQGKTDIAAVGDLPIAVAVLNGGPVAVLATISTCESDYAVVGRRDKGVTGPETLKGKRIAVTLGTSGDYFLDSMLIRQKLTRENVRIVDRKPEEMVDTLVRDEADAAAIWEPRIGDLRKQLGANASVLPGKGVYDGTFNLVANIAFTNRRPEAVRKLLRGLVRAERFYSADRAAAEKIIGEALQFNASETRLLMTQYDISLSLKQSLIVLLEEESRWAMRSKSVDAGRAPNFLKHIDMRGLLDVKPDAVTVIH